MAWYLDIWYIEQCFPRMQCQTVLNSQFHCQLTSTHNDGSSLYADVSGFMIRSFITSDNDRPDLLFLIQCKCLYILELTAGFESNLKNNAMQKKKNYTNLVKDMRSNHKCVNLSMSCLGVFLNECSTFSKMMNDICNERWQKATTLSNKKK